MKIRFAAKISAVFAAVLVVLAAALLTVMVFAEGTDMEFSAVDCVITDEVDPADAVTRQNYNGRDFSRFDATEKGQYITYGIDIPEAGDYYVYIEYRSHSSCGYADVYVNDDFISEFNNGEGTANTLKEFSLGKLSLEKGVNRVRFVVTAPNKSPEDERAYFLNIMSIKVKKVKSIDEMGLPEVALPEKVSDVVYTGVSNDKVEIYPFPEVYERSLYFEMTADGLEVPVRNFMNSSYDDYDYAEFSLKKGPVEVTVTVPGKITSYSISPLKLGIEGTVSGNTLTFTMEKDEYLILTINNYKELVITADPPQTDVPESEGEGIFNVVTQNYRADNTGSYISTGSIQKAIDDASAWGTENGSAGIVYVPAGVYRIGTIALKSNVHMYLEGGAVLYATGRAQDYIKRAFKDSIGMPVTQMIYVYNNRIYDPYEEEFKNPENYVYSENIKIYGRGTVDARGRLMEEQGFLMQTLVAYNCENFISDGITYCDTNIWSIIPGCSDNMQFLNLKVLNMLGLHENDAIDVDNCTNVLISNSIGIALDDPYSVKTYSGGTELFRSMIDEKRGCENIVFEDCLSWTICYGFKTGQGAGYDQIDITFRDSVVYNCSVGIGVNHKYGGGTMKNIIFDNIDIERCTWTNGSWQNWMDIECISGSSKEGVYPVQNVIISNINIRDAGKNMSYITGYTGSEYAEGRVNGVVLANIYMPGSDSPALSFEEMKIMKVELADGVQIAKPLSAGDSAFVPYISYKQTGASHSIRIIVSSVIARLGKAVDSVELVVDFGNGKSVTRKLSASGGELTLYKMVSAAGDYFTADEGGALFGIAVTDIPADAWQTVTVTLRDPETSHVYTSCSTEYDELSPGFSINEDGNIPQFGWDDME